ncbi:MAG TPA: hypothetical protein PLP63_06630 [Saprospiraceae bacterium]|nr:hypothetical protein [Saprospiraceae bacterium]
MDQALINLLKIAFSAGVVHGSDSTSPAFEQWMEMPVIAQILNTTELNEKKEEIQGVAIEKNGEKFISYTIVCDTDPNKPNGFKFIQALKRGKLQLVDMPMITD